LQLGHDFLRLNSQLVAQLFATLFYLEYEKDNKGNHKAEEARRFGQCEAEEEVGKLARGGRRVAERAGEEAAENVSDAKAGTDKSEAREARADHFSCCDIHDDLLTS
jgi:hypothetical protein